MSLSLGLSDVADLISEGWSDIELAGATRRLALRFTYALLQGFNDPQSLLFVRSLPPSEKGSDGRSAYCASSSCFSGEICNSFINGSSLWQQCLPVVIDFDGSSVGIKVAIGVV